jgi:tRNA (guanine26-N2/guanine27-N2)-dimethyltransferase
MHGGMLALTATDLQVLHGLFNNAAKRRYYGTPIKTEFSNEIAIRLIIGCVSFVVGRLDISFQPLFVDHDMHYYRAYLRILNTPDQEENIGYIIFCRNCKDRYSHTSRQTKCRKCNHETEIAGPLWIGKLFEKKFVSKMRDIRKELTVHKRCERILDRSEAEAEMPPTYYTLDEIASKMNSAPLKLSDAISKLTSRGFKASMTSLNPSGFRTNCEIDEIIQIFSTK